MIQLISYEKFFHFNVTSKNSTMTYKTVQITQNVLCQIDRFKILKYQLLKLAGRYNIGHFDIRTTGMYPGCFPFGFFASGNHGG